MPQRHHAQRVEGEQRGPVARLGPLPKYLDLVRCHGPCPLHGRDDGGEGAIPSPGAVPAGCPEGQDA